ncbi:MAG: PAS domain-containing protein [Rhizobiaceae bacterium]
MNTPANKSNLRIIQRSTKASKLDMLISHYNSIDEQLRQEIEADRDVDAIQFLDLQLQKILGSLKQYRAKESQEAYKHLMFFLGDVTSTDSSLSRPVDSQMMSLLLQDYMLPEPLSQSSPQFCDIESIINNSANRISLIDMEHRYQFTSQSNASNYGCAPRDICGQHVAEVIGGDRFIGRAKGFFERCFGGEIVEYAHVLEETDSDVTRYMKCRMQPHFDTSGARAGAIVTMTDISRELLSGVNEISLEPIVPITAGPDNN